MSIEKIISKIDDESFFLNSSFSDMANKVIKPELASINDPVLIEKLQNEYAVFSVDTTEIITKKDFSINLGHEISNYSEQRIYRIIEYLKLRCDETTSEIVKARYNHIIWLYFRKNDINPNSAIAFYTSFAKRNELSDLNKIDFLTKAFIIAFSIKDNIDPIMTIIIDTMCLAKTTKAILLGFEVIQKYRSVFKKVLRIDMFSHCYGILKKQIESGKNCFFLIETIDLMTGILQNMDSEMQLKWFELKGEIYELLAKEKEELLQLEFLGLAIHAYKKAKNDERENNCKLKLEKIWESYGGDNFPRQELGEPFNHFMNEAFKLTERRCDTILEELRVMPIDAIAFILLSPAVIPSTKSIREAVQKRGRPVYMHIASVSVFDENGNKPEPINSEEQESKYLFFQEYGLHMLTLKHFLQRFIKSLIAQNKLEIKAFTQMLTTRSILGEISRNRRETWIDAITPAINYFFSQVNASLIAHSNVHVDFSLCIDSLTLKLEGILRDIFSMNGLSPKKVGEKKTEEHDLNYLLNHELMLHLYDENHVVFLKFILTEQLGMNLRNIVAHALKTNNEIYNESVMHCVFVCIIIVVFGIKSNSEDIPTS